MLEEKITSWIEQILEGYSDLFLVEIDIKGKPGNQKVIVLVDGDPGITIDQCAEISRQLASILEEEDAIPDKYFLEVSSPGLDMPLKLERQYKKNVGRNVKVTLENGDRLKGELTHAENNMITILEEKSQNPKELDMKDIKKTNILVSFN